MTEADRARPDRIGRPTSRPAGATPAAPPPAPAPGADQAERIERLRSRSAGTAAGGGRKRRPAALATRIAATGISGSALFAIVAGLAFGERQAPAAAPEATAGIDQAGARTPVGADPVESAGSTGAAPGGDAATRLEARPVLTPAPTAGAVPTTGRTSGSG